MSYNGIDDEVAIELLSNGNYARLTEFENEVRVFNSSITSIHIHCHLRAVADLRHLESILLCWNEITAKTMLALDPILPKFRVGLRVRGGYTSTVSWHYPTPCLASARDTTVLQR